MLDDLKPKNTARLCGACQAVAELAGLHMHERESGAVRMRAASGDTDPRRNDSVVAEAGVNGEMPVRADSALSGEPGELLPEKPAALRVERPFPPASDVSGRVGWWLLAASDAVGGGCGDSASDQLGD